jgi:hypothetical protein
MEILVLILIIRMIILLLIPTLIANIPLELLAIVVVMVIVNPVPVLPHVHQTLLIVSNIELKMYSFLKK